MVSHEERKIEIPGFTLALKIWNPKSTRRVLCLHGKLDNAASFDLLARHLPDMQLVAIDYPGTGLSSHYPKGVLPHWKNDSLLLLNLIKKLEWEKFDIIAHSFGSLLASFLAIAQPHKINKIVFLDILGPTVNFIENVTTYFHRDVETYLTHEDKKRTLYPTKELAIKDRMTIGNISYEAAEVLVERGVKKCEGGYVWTFDSRLHCLSLTLPHEDELRALFREIKAPVCLVRAKQGVPYPEKVFQERAQSIKNLSIFEIEGGHHVHMDDPVPAAKIISEFL